MPRGSPLGGSPLHRGGAVSSKEWAPRTLQSPPKRPLRLPEAPSSFHPGTSILRRNWRHPQ
eukprot:3245286-Pyramimonas_sp.AAC.1